MAGTPVELMVNGPAFAAAWERSDSAPPLALYSSALACGLVLAWEQTGLVDNDGAYLVASATSYSCNTRLHIAGGSVNKGLERGGIVSRGSCVGRHDGGLGDWRESWFCWIVMCRAKEFRDKM